MCPNHPEQYLVGTVNVFFNKSFCELPYKRERERTLNFLYVLLMVYKAYTTSRDSSFQSQKFFMCLKVYRSMFWLLYKVIQI
jgi:hypothetical protein